MLSQELAHNGIVELRGRSGSRRVRKFLRLSSAERRLLISAALLLGVIRLGLLLFPFSVVRRVVARVMPVPSTLHKTQGPPIDQFVWAVGVASRYVPQVTCLTQALALQVLLARRGHLARLRIGVLRDEERQLRAHAWVECEGKVVLGGSERGYTALPDFEAKRP